MKKISLILVFTIICSMFSIFTPVAVSANAEVVQVTEGAEEMNMLICLGAKTDKNLDDKLTVGDFAKLLAGSSVEPEDYLPEGEELTDEEITAYAVAYLTAYGALNEGIDVSGELDYDTAVKALVSMVGFSKISGEIDYKTYATKLGILKGVSPANKKALTMSEAVLMIYNTLFVKLIEVYNIDETGINYTQSDDETILSKNRNILSYTGFLYDNGTTSVSGESQLNKGFVKIGEKIMNVGETNIADFLAYYVDVLYTDTNGKCEIKCFSTTESKNEVINIPGDDIKPGSSLTTIDYDDEKGKQRRVNVSTQASYILNGTWTLSLSDDDIKPANGQITLIDVDFNKVYDIVMVESFRNVVVREVVVDEFVIVGLYDGLSYKDEEGNELTYDDTYDFDSMYDEEEIEVYKNGEEVPFSTIAPYDVIAVYEGNKYLRIEICTYVENAEIKTLYGKGLSTKEGKNFELAPEYALLSKTYRPVPGKFGTLYFGKDGDIVYFDENKKNAKVTGYLHAIGRDYRDVFFKIFTETGTWAIVDVAEIIYIDDVKKEEKDLFEEEEIYNKFYNSDGSVKRQLMQYSTNEEGLATRIYTLAYNEDDGLKPTEKTGKFYYSSASGSGASFQHESNSSDYSPADFYLESTATTFLVPADESQENAYRAYTNGKTPFTHGKYPTGLTGYYASLSSQKKGTVDYLVQIMSVSDPKFDHRSSVVVKTGEMLDEEQNVQSFITVLYYGEEKTYLSMNGEKFNGIQTGDVIQIELFNDQVYRYRKVFSVNSQLTSKDIRDGGYADSDITKFYNVNNIQELNNSDGFINSSNVKEANWYNQRAWYGTIDYKSGNYMTMVTKDGSSYKLKANEKASASYYKTKIYVYDETTDTVRMGTVNDIYAGSKVFTYIEAALMVDILVFKEK